MIDSHLHIFKPCTKGATYTPKGSVSLEKCMNVLTNHKIDKAVLIQPSFLGYDNSYILESLEKYPDRLRGVVVLKPNTDFAYLKQLDLLGVKGIRLNYFNQSIETEAYQKLFDDVLALNWHVEIYAKNDDLPDVLSQIKNKELQIVIDHFGLPNSENDDVFNFMLQSPLNLFVKLSAPYRFQFTDINRAIEMVIIHRGKHKILWGSDYPFTRFEEVFSYKQALHFISCYPDQSIQKNLLENSLKLFDF